MRALVAVVVVATASLFACEDEPTRSAAPEHAPAAETTYECPMHCVRSGDTEPYTQSGPGQCPVCGMDLVPKE
jgi:hypothetical protein